MPETMQDQERLARLGIELPPPPKAVGLYKPCLVIDRWCYTSGHVPLQSDGTLIRGCLGADATVEQGQAAARQCGLAILSTLCASLGELKRIHRLVKLLGFVRCTPEFTDQPAVINGCSELFKQVFGDDLGVGVRSAVGTNALPLGVMVEVEAVFELHE